MMDNERSERGATKGERRYGKSHRLSGEKILICPPSEDDMPRICAWFKDPSIEEFFNLERPVVEEADWKTIFFAFDSIQTKVKTTFTVDRLAQMVADVPLEGLASQRLSYKTSAKAVGLMFSIVRKSDDFLLGAIVLEVSLVHRIGTIRTIIDERFRGQRLGGEAKKLVLEYGFDRLELDKICSNTLEGNKRNYKCNLGCGFQEEGRLRKHALINGVRKDLIVMGILKEDYERLRNKTKPPTSDPD